MAAVSGREHIPGDWPDMIMFAGVLLACVMSLAYVVLA
jgi:hypothetical protein